MFGGRAASAAIARQASARDKTAATNARRCKGEYAGTTDLPERNGVGARDIDYPFRRDPKGSAFPCAPLRVAAKREDAVTSSRLPAASPAG